LGWVVGWLLFAALNIEVKDDFENTDVRRFAILLVGNATKWSGFQLNISRKGENM